MDLSNRSVRIIVSLIAIPLLLFVAYIGRLPFLFFVSILTLTAFHEFFTMAQKKEAHINLAAGFLSVLIICINSYSPFIEINILFLLITIAILSAELFRKKKSAIINSGLTLFGVFYVGLFSSSLISIREFYHGNEIMYEQSGFLIISILISIWVCDSAAYFLGTAFGKHKLFPRISPNKSWEGAVAGFVFALISMAALKILLIDFFSWQDVMVFGLIVGVIGQTGDLVESMIKRDAGVKDSSSIIPGHGGMLDRFDSLIYSAPFIYMYLYFQYY